MKTAFPDGWNTPADAIRFLRAFDGGDAVETGEWDFDDFINEKSANPVIERCRLRARDELFELVVARDTTRSSALISEMIADLEAGAAQFDSGDQ